MFKLAFRPSVGHEAGEEDVQIYQEAMQNGTKVYLSKHTPHSSTRGAYDGTPVLAAYPPLEQLQQKRLAARRHNTTFVYDFPSVFGNALRKIWLDRDSNGECDGPLPGGASPPALPYPPFASLPCPPHACPPHPCHTVYPALLCIACIGVMLLCH